MIPEKRKNKELSVQGWLYRFVSSLQMDVVIPQLLETCAELLQRKHDIGSWKVRKTTVELTKVDNDTYTLYIKQWSNGLIEVEAKGYLNSWGEDTTRMITDINLTQNSYRNFLLAPVVFALFFFIFSFSFNSSRFFPDSIILCAIGTFFYWHAMRRERHHLKRLIEDTFQPDLRKKKKR